LPLARRADDAPRRIRVADYDHTVPGGRIDEAASQSHSREGGETLIKGMDPRVDDLAEDVNDVHLGGDVEDVSRFDDYVARGPAG